MVKWCLALIVFFGMQVVYAETAAPYNIILIISDQEQNTLLKAADYHLPARDIIKAHGITFTNHYTASAMCTPSRAAFLTGSVPQANGVFDQMEYSYVNNLDPKRPNIGSVLKSLGYRTAYFGKFEMNKTLLASKPNVNYSTLAQPYGFDTFNFNGDVGGSPQQGYQVDSFFVGEAIQWLHTNVNAKQTKPFFMVLSLLNPHDIMYGDANLPGSPVAQVAGAPVILPPPANSLYAKKWQFQLPPSLQESLTAKGMPGAYDQYQQGWSGTLGFIPTERKDMWEFYYNYYLNALQDNDNNLQTFVNTISDMDLWKNTVIIVTADHGEMGGAHGGLRGKGPMVYEENTHIPLIIDHPQGAKNAKAVALTSHLDLLPTIVGLTGLPDTQINPILKNFSGHNFANIVFTNPQNLHAVRKGILFNYLGISTIDGAYLKKMLTASLTHQTLPSLKEVNMNQRGFIAFVYDGRYKFARFYAPSGFNTPKTLDEIFKYNDVQLFDLQNDPNEQNNLALDKNKNQAIILRMNALLNELMSKEVGQYNNPKFLPADIQNKTRVLLN